MLYRTSGQFKTTYRTDQALFPIRQDAFLLGVILIFAWTCLLYTSPSPRDLSTSRMPSSA